MRIQELVEAIPVGSSTQPAANPNTPPQQQAPAVPGQPQPAANPNTPPQQQAPAVPGQPQPAAPTQQQNSQQAVPPPGKAPQPTLGNQQPNATATPATPSPEIKQGMQAMSDQFNALKLKYDQLQKQILNPASPPAQPSTPARV